MLSNPTYAACTGKQGRIQGGGVTWVMTLSLRLRDTTDLPGAPPAWQGHHRLVRGTICLAGAPLTTGLPGASQSLPEAPGHHSVHCARCARCVLCALCALYALCALFHLCARCVLCALCEAARGVRACRSRDGQIRSSREAPRGPSGMLMSSADSRTPSNEIGHCTVRRGGRATGPPVHGRPTCSR